MLAWVRTRPRKDTFLLVHLFDPHVPQDPPPPFRDHYRDRLYDGEIAYIDREIGRLLDGIRERFRTAKLQIVLLTDHGEGLGYITPASTRPVTSDSLAVWYFPPAERGRALGLPLAARTAERGA